MCLNNKVNFRNFGQGSVWNFMMKLTLKILVRGGYTFMMVDFWSGMGVELYDEVVNFEVTYDDSKSL